jgi:hypothetical protein
LAAFVSPAQYDHNVIVLLPEINPISRAEEHTQLANPVPYWLAIPIISLFQTVKAVKYTLAPHYIA